MSCKFSVPVGQHSRYRWYKCGCGKEQEMLDTKAEVLLNDNITKEEFEAVLIEGRRKRKFGRIISKSKGGGS